MPSNASAFAASVERMCSRAGISSSATARRAETWIAVGITSFDDWPKLTWSFGWTGPSPSRICDARCATTSFAFMFVDVPEPVW